MSTRFPRKPWKESRVKLAQAVVLTLDGPGNEWLMLCRGTRSPHESAPKQTRSPPRRRRTGHA